MGKAVDDMAAGFGARFATGVTLGSRGLLLLGRPPMWVDRGSNSKLQIAQRHLENPRPDLAVWGCVAVDLEDGPLFPQA